MPLARRQDVADTREIMETKSDLHHALHNKQKRTKIWTTDFKKKF